MNYRETSLHGTDWLYDTLRVSDQEIVTAGKDGSIRIEDIHLGRVTRRLNGHLGAVYDLAVFLMKRVL